MGNMKGILHGLSAALLLLAAPQTLSAQFSTGGDDPSALKWSSFRTEHYRMIYPRGLDSLAKVYAVNLERYRVPVSWSGGYVPGELQRRRIPVILHAFSGISNASVTWAPKRMEFHTLPDPYDPDPVPWEKNLAIHESRHVSQMQLGYDGMFKPFHWLLGDMFPGAVAALYANQETMEGDAVVAETALTDYGRGRSGDFLNYYMSAFGSGDWRNWYRWKYGSWRRYTPNHYAFGYLYLAGTRVFYDAPGIMDEYYGRISRNPLRFNTLARVIKNASGMRFTPSFEGIMRGFNDIWKENAERRAPFTESVRLVPVPSWYEEFRSPVLSSSGLLALRSGLLRSASLVSVSEEGRVTRLRPFSSSVSSLAYDPNLDRLYWSETVRDERWSLAADSRIRYINLSESLRIRDLTKGDRLFNPAPSPDGWTVVSVRYGYDGVNSLVFTSALDGREIRRVDTPPGVRPVEPVWKDGSTVVFSAVGENGMCISSFSGESFSEILPETPVKIKNLSRSDEGILFTSDRTGVNEVYLLSGGSVRQLTSTEYGAGDAVSSGSALYYTMLQTGLPRGKRSKGEGRLLYASASDRLLHREVDFGDIYRDPVAETLSRQERAIGGDVREFSGSDAAVSQAKPYSKALNLFRFHSWCPLMVKYDDYSSLNMDIVSNSAFLGATAFFQNDLGTASGSLSYGYRPSRQGAEAHVGHLHFKYSGLYPVLEFDMDFGGREAYRFRRQETYAGSYRFTQQTMFYGGVPYMDAAFRVYVPLRFSSGGWHRGLTPRISYRVGNDLFDRSVYRIDLDEAASGSYRNVFAGTTRGRNVFLQTLSASFSAYAVQDRAPSLEYPRLGLGVEAGAFARPGMTDLYSPGMYLYAYGYLPGILRQQGLKLTGQWQHCTGAGHVSSFLNMLPRGFQYPSMTIPASPDQVKFTADYAIPFKMECGLGSAFRVTHFMLKPHADLAFFSGGDGAGASFCSLGTELSLRLVNFLWIPFPTSIGVVLDVNGTDLPRFSSAGNYVGMIFNIEI